MLQDFIHRHGYVIKYVCDVYDVSKGFFNLTSGMMSTWHSDLALCTSQWCPAVLFWHARWSISTLCSIFHFAPFCNFLPPLRGLKWGVNKYVMQAVRKCNSRCASGVSKCDTRCEQMWHKVRANVTHVWRNVARCHGVRRGIQLYTNGVKIRTTQNTNWEIQ